MFKTERDMCAEFIKAINRRSKDTWTPYPETGGFDILLVRDHDGFQIGIEAKLRLNAKVIAQSLPSYWDTDHGPDCRAVLVPKSKVGDDLKAICYYIGITIITIGEKPKNFYMLDAQDGDPRYVIHPNFPRCDREEFFQNWFEWSPDKRLKLPEVIPDCEAGCPSPLQLTEWKIKAIKIIIILESFGHVTRQDFKALNISSQRWTQSTGWLENTGERGVYIKGEHIPDLRSQHPRNFIEIANLIHEWLPKHRKDYLK